MKHSVPPTQQGKLHPNPLYKQIEQDIRSRIESGQWLPNMILPSRPKLAKEYGVGLTTLERAIDNLIEDGVLRAEANRGTFVTDMNRQPTIVPTSPTRIIEQLSPLSLPNHTTNPTLGIIAANELDWPLDWEEAHDWLLVLLSSLEQAFSLAGGRTLYIKRYINDTTHLSIPNAIRSALDQKVDALAIVNVNDAQQIMKDVQGLFDVLTFPLVIHTWQNEHPVLPYVDYDNLSSGYYAGRHMVEAGYQRLWYIDSLQQWWGEQRFQGVQTAVQSYRSLEDALINYCKDHYSLTPYSGYDDYNYTVDLGYEIGKDLLKDRVFLSMLETHGTNPPGIIAVKDALAYGLHKALVEAGKQPGRDFGLLGFDDDLPSRKLSLTTLRPPLQDMGIEAARVILQKLRGHVTIQQVRHSSHLIVRTSTRRT